MARVDARALAERRHRRGDDLLGEALLVDLRDVEDPEAALAVGDVQILAARLHAKRVRRPVMDRRRQPPPAALVGGVALRVRELCRSLPITACGSSSSVTATASTPPWPVATYDEAADEVHEVGAEQQQLRHHRVVVAVGRDVAVGAGLGFGRRARCAARGC